MIGTELLDAYGAAIAEHQRAQRLMDEAQDRFWKLRKKARKQLGKKVGEKHAYLVAGVNFADRRSVKAFTRMTQLRNQICAQIAAQPRLVEAYVHLLTERMKRD